VLARRTGECWIAGLAAYRLSDYAAAQASFRQVADDSGRDGWLRAAGAYWAARSAAALGDSAAALTFLRQAATYSDTFYGMIAERQVQMQVGSAAPNDPVGQLILASYAGPIPDLRGFVRANPAAHRAAALAQLGRADEARQELRAGMARAATQEDQDNWAALLTGLAEALAHPSVAPDTYPTPALEPRDGFTIDKALVYAIVRQESRFNPLAVSPVGAVGLMQLMPDAAARAAGDDKLKADMSPLFDPSLNLRVGQDYVSWLMERGVGYDILRTVAAYNGGPGMLQRTIQMLGDDADSLMVIECLPAQETRDYVRKVMAGYWGYKRLWGEDARTLDAVAAGARFIDARLDLPETGNRSTKTATQALQLGMR
jgi:soluble lytic murein transglycosylase-like protein